MKNYAKYFMYLCMPIAITGMTLLFIPSTGLAAQQNGRQIDSNLKAKLPKYYPDSFMGQDIVTAVNPAKRTITFGSTAFAYGINTKVHTLSSNFASIQNLPVDTPVGFNFIVGDNNTYYLTEAWVLPAGSVRPH